jgi:hypothetical protein
MLGMQGKELGIGLYLPNISINPNVSPSAQTAG